MYVFLVSGTSPSYILDGHLIYLGTDTRISLTLNLSLVLITLPNIGVQGLPSLVVRSGSVGLPLLLLVCLFDRYWGVAHR